MAEENLKSQNENHDQDMSENYYDVSCNLENLESCFFINSEVNKNDLNISNNTTINNLSTLNSSPLKAEGKRKQNQMEN